MVERKVSLQVVFDENLKKDKNLPSTRRLAFDDLGDFIEERERVKRLVEKRISTDLKVDYSQYSNHVFFDSAESKLGIATSKILNDYPFNGTQEERDSFFLTGSGYEKWIYDQWPREVAYSFYDGAGHYISASDGQGKLHISASNLYVSAWAKPVISGEHPVVQYFSRRSNNVPWSEHFDRWSGTRASLVLTTNPPPIPASISASVIKEDSTAASTHLAILNTVVAPSGSRHVASCYFSASNRDWILFQANVGGDSLATAYVDTTNGVLGTVAGNTIISSAIENVGGGWYRAFLYFTGSSNTTTSYRMWIAEANGDVTFSGLNQNSIYIFGAQLDAYVEEPVTLNSYNFPYLATSGTIKEDDREGYHLYFSGTTDPHLRFDLFSGSSVTSVSASYAAFTASWNNVAGLYDKNAGLLSLYINASVYDSASLSYGNLERTPSNVYIGSGTRSNIFSSTFALYSGSLDEIRILTTGSDLFHKKNYNRPITSEDYVKLYYTFNEGITSTSSIDSFVIDYSQSGLHGRFQNYSAIARVSGATMQDDPGNPILYSFHSRVISLTGSQTLSASLYDLNNNNHIFNLIPEGVLTEDDNADGLLRSFTLAMARYFDELKLYIDQFVNLKFTNYEGIDETPDLFLPHLKRYFGWKISEHFNDANPLEFLFGESVLLTGSLSTALVDIRNQFWRRTLNNLPLLVKSKGTRKNLDYLFNILGINSYNLRIKEYGYLPGSSIQDERISKQKVESRLGIGTGTLGSNSSSFVYITSASLMSDGGITRNEFTIETMAQLPFVSASYSGSTLTGGLWQLDNSLVSTVESSSSVRCYWVRSALTNDTGKIVLESSSSISSSVILSSSNLSIFDGNFIHVAAGRDASSLPFLSVRRLDGDTIDLTEDVSGSSAILAHDTSGTLSLFIGAHTSSHVFPTGILQTQGFFGETRFWDRKLSGSELNDHTLNYQSIGLRDPFTDRGFLRGQWALNENLTSSAAGILSGVVDLSRNSRDGVGVQFGASENPYERFLHDFNYLSPAIDLKWTENKIRIRNATEIDFRNAGTDTNEMSLEFNYVDSLNEDIVKIFSTLDSLNDIIGQPIFKYRDEYSNLEGVRREYFQRLGDSLNFSQFFDLFKWFDRKISDSIKQLLPARVKFVGGEQVVESHMLERPKYKYNYPIFRTPQDPPEASITASCDVDGQKQQNITGDLEIGEVEGAVMPQFVSTFSDREDRTYRNAQPSDPPHIFTLEDLGLPLTSSYFAPYFVKVDQSNGNLYVGGGLSVAGTTPYSYSVLFLSSSSGWEEIRRDDAQFFTTLGMKHGAITEGTSFYKASDNMFYFGGCMATASVGDAGDGFILSSSDASSGSWFVSDRQQQSAFAWIKYSDITEDSSGTLWTCGYGQPLSPANWAWFVRSGSDGFWNSADSLDASYAGLNAQICPVRAHKIFANSQDHIYVIGGLDRLINSTDEIFSASSGLIRRSVDHGATWLNVVEYSGSLYGNTEFYSFAKDSAGNYYVGGKKKDNGFIISSSDDGSTWNTFVDNSVFSNYQSLHVVNNEFEEYLIAGGTDDKGSGRVGAIKLSDGNRQLFDIFEIATGSIWSIDSYSGSVYFTFSRNYFADLARYIAYYGVSQQNSTGSLGKLVIPSGSEFRPNFYPIKIDGDSVESVQVGNVGINYRNDFARRTLIEKDKNNKE